ncbi:hypothetical protein RHMOL_Rhmol02G0055700 [Rhododendron molle]|uniref:Uncharacterized protein n=1 Tax=Rhododendron molle TaxID=49168 RepID=A0ACC0PN81_RHOML|nr:hypothetical protein RHMOL_Rhmol02G0055700 [Rhododendron molle]
MNRADFGFAVLSFFFKCGYKADVASFNTPINGYILQDNTANAVKLFLRLMKDEDIIPNEVTYETIINGLCKLENTTMAIQLVRSMQIWNFKPNVVIYSTIIGSLCKDGNIDDAFSFLSEMREWDVMPNVVTYNSWLMACANWVNGRTPQDCWET